MANTTPKGQINAPDQLDCMSTLRTDNSHALAEITRLTALCQEYRENGDRLMRVADEYKADRTTAERNENAAMVAIERKDKALQMALECLEIQPQVKHIVDAMTTIKEAL